MAGKAEFGIKLSLNDMMDALEKIPEVEEEFYNQLAARIINGGFDGVPGKRRPPPPEKIDTTIPNPSAVRLNQLMTSPSHTI
jgi:hypothetical protein